MANFLNKVRCLSKKMKMNQIYFWKQQPFHSNSPVFDKPSFTEKPPWLKKLKMQQAAMQQDDGRPTFLKKGFPDKLLFNLTLAGIISSLFWSYKVLETLDMPYRKKTD